MFPTLATRRNFRLVRIGRGDYAVYDTRDDRASATIDFSEGYGAYLALTAWQGLEETMRSRDLDDAFNMAIAAIEIREELAGGERMKPYAASV